MELTLEPCMHAHLSLDFSSRPRLFVCLLCYACACCLVRFGSLSISALPRSRSCNLLEATCLSYLLGACHVTIPIPFDVRLVLLLGGCCWGLGLCFGRTDGQAVRVACVALCCCAALLSLVLRFLPSAYASCMRSIKKLRFNVCLVLQTSCFSFLPLS